MIPGSNFKSMFFNLFSVKESFVDNKHDLDVNFYHDTQYLTSDKFKTNFKDFSENSFSVWNLNTRNINKNFDSFNLNTRNINKNFESFNEFYLDVNHIFRVSAMIF